MSEPFWFFDRRFDSVPHVTVFALERRWDIFWKLELKGVAVCPSQQRNLRGIVICNDKLTSRNHRSTPSSLGQFQRSHLMYKRSTTDIKPFHLQLVILYQILKLQKCHYATIVSKNRCSKVEIFLMSRVVSSRGPQRGWPTHALIRPVNECFAFDIQSNAYISQKI